MLPIIILNWLGKMAYSIKRVDSPDFKGDVGLVVVSDQAVEVEKGKFCQGKNG